LAPIVHAQSRVALIDTVPRPPAEGDDAGWFVAVI
jgi:hypothetical protein